MNLTPGLTAWQTSPTPGRRNLSSLRERKVSQWKCWVAMETTSTSSLFFFPFSIPPFFYSGPLLNVLASMKSYVRTGEAAHPAPLHPPPSLPSRPGIARSFRGRQLSYLSGSASTCCRWFTTSDADSLGSSFGDKLPGSPETWDELCIIFPPVEIINFWGSHLLWKRSIQLNWEPKGGKKQKHWRLTRLFPNGLNLLTSGQYILGLLILVCI